MPCDTEKLFVAVCDSSDLLYIHVKYDNSGIQRNFEDYGAHKDPESAWKKASRATATYMFGTENAI